MSPPVAGFSWKRLSRRFRTPLRTATGVYETRDSLVLRFADASGRVGYGEIAPWPGFPTETLEAAEAELNRMRNEECGMKNEYASPACFLHEVSDNYSTFFIPHSSFPCLAAALSHARAWAASGWGEKNVALPCAGLARSPESADVLLRSGYTTLKLKIGAGVLRDEQRDVAGLIRRCGPDTRLRLDANGALDAPGSAAWCDFLSEFPEIEFLEQPMRAGCEADMLAIAERAGVAGRLAFDESVAGANFPDKNFPGVVVVKPAFAGDLAGFRRQRDAFGPDRIAYGSVFESPFGRQAALCVAGERPGKFAAGFGTLGVFDDDLDIHESGPVAATVSRDAAFWEALWNNVEAAPSPLS